MCLRLEAAGKLHWAERFSWRIPVPPNPPPEFAMSTKYWGIYVLYIERCVKENYENDIDPAHYEMEWNHFWPKSIFGDWPVGQWLTLKQHAIASALQTLAFGENCMYGGQKIYLPPKLLELSWPYYKEASSEIGTKTMAVLQSEKNEKGQSLFALKGALACHAKRDEKGRSLNAMKLHENKDENGKSLHAIKSGKRTKEKLGKKVVVTLQDESELRFNSIKDTAKYFGIQSEYIRKRIRKGPARWGKLTGLRFRLVE